MVSTGSPGGPDEPAASAAEFAEEGGEALPPTLGARLDAAGRSLARRHMTDFAWAAPLTRTLVRIDALRGAQGDRFRRQEVAPESEARSLAWTVSTRGRRPRAAGAEMLTQPPLAARTSPRSLEQSPPSPGEAPATVRGRPLDPDVRGRVRAVAGTAADILRVRDDPEADRIARTHRADAVTRGREVLFRAGRFAPREAAGFGLLVHEATHVEQLIRRGQAGPRPADAHDDERAALTVERRARRLGGPAPVAPPRVPGPGGQGSPEPARLSTQTQPAGPSATSPIRAAAHDRDAGALSPGFDVDSLRRGLVDDLMRQLRTEFERGG